MIEEYLRKAYAPLVRYMNKEVALGKKIALWGAGNKGKEFLKITDGSNKFISYVFDKDERKWGEALPTGHLIVDYKKNKADIVLVSGSNIIVETKYRLDQLPYSVKVINIDDIVIGNINFDEKNRKGKYATSSSNTIAAMVILFHPDELTVENIKSYKYKVDMLYLYDNSPSDNKEMFSSILEDEKCKYVYANGNNDGLGKPINIIAKQAIADGADWLLTFDQDSRADSCMVDRMRNYVNCNEADRKIAILGPMIMSPNDSSNGVEYSSTKSFVMYVRNVIQSGSLINLHIFEKVGAYYEKLFIDYVDFEYCLRLRSKGYRIAKLSNAKLIHQVDNQYKVYNLAGKKIFLGKYSPQRYYYQYRNILYCKKVYKQFDPIFAGMCEKNLRDLEYAAQIDDNKEQNIVAITKAKNDYLLL